MRLPLIRRRASVASLAVAALVTGTVGGVLGAQAAPRVTLPTTVLAGDVLPGLQQARDLGPTAPGTKVLVGVVFAHPHAAAVSRLERRIYNKHSAEYHHFLTPVQFATRFGNSGAAFARVEAWAKRHGMKLAHANTTRDYFTVVGTAKQAEHTFDVSLHNYRFRGQRFYANTAAPRVPAGLGVTGVIGLNSLLKGSIPSQPTRRTASPKPAQSLCAPAVCVGLTTPQDLWSVYDAPTDNYGQGQQMAILGEGETDPVINDLREFEKLDGLPPIPVTVVHTEGPDADYSDSSGETEWDIDTQSSTGMAPEALGETLYFGTSLSDASLLDDLASWVQDPHGALQASMSIDECEENPLSSSTGIGLFGASTQYTESSEASLAQAVVEGRTLFNSTGDTGSSCPILPVDVNGVGNELYPVVNYPASSPNVVGVGGTVLYTDGTGAATTGLAPSGASRVAEYAWTFSGGGTSVTFPEPSYQKNDAAPPATGDCLDAPDGSPVTGQVPCRAVPDIAAQSGDVPTNGYSIVSGGVADSQGGGTSLSSPISLGLWTRINAAAPAVTSEDEKTTYPGLGFANDVYYPDFKAHSGDFFDVGGGASSPPTSNGYYTSGPGDDYLSGLGIPDYKLVTQHVDGGNTAPTHNVLPDYGSGSGSTGPNLDPCAAALFDDPSGDDAYIGDPNGGGSNPQLDIVAGNMTVSGSTLTTTMVINDLSTNQAQAAGAANIYYFLWNFTPPGGTATQYFTDVTVDSATQAVTYGDGTVSGNQFNDANTDTGSFNAGKNGTAVVNVPLANVGHPGAGAVLLAPTAQTRVLVGSSLAGGFVEQADGAGPRYDFQLGAVCPTPSPTPTATSSATASASATPTPTPSSSSTVAPPGLPLPGIPGGGSSPSPSPTASSTPNASPKPTATHSATPSPTPSRTAHPTASPTPSKPAKAHPPSVRFQHQKATRHHARRLVITVVSHGSRITKLLHVHLRHCEWSLGSAHPKHFKGGRAKLRIIVTDRHRGTAGKVAFRVVDAAGQEIFVAARV